jgi:hypothetical protein
MGSRFSADGGDDKLMQNFGPKTWTEKMTWEN